MPDAAPGTAAEPERIRAAFVRACELDVMARKPGNVSMASAGHRMLAGQFLDSARAAADPLCAPGAPVGARIEAAVDATLAAAGCNTNLGIVLLCAPIAAAAERRPGARTPAALRTAIAGVLETLDERDAAGAYRAIAAARPGGLGRVEAHDVHSPPSIGLTAAMRLAADRDSIARQYAQDFGDLFETGLPAAGAFDPADDTAAIAAAQSVYLTYLARWPDSHIVRKLGAAMAHTVMEQAAPWLERARRGGPLQDDAAFAEWDQWLKQAGVNPGTTADLTVATLMLACLLTP